MDVTPKAHSAEAENKRVGLHETEGFHPAKETVKRMKGNLKTGRKYSKSMYLVRK